MKENKVEPPIKILKKPIVLREMRKVTVNSEQVRHYIGNQIKTANYNA